MRLLRAWRLLRDEPALLPENPYELAARLVKEGNWRGRRFLDATEHLALIEGRLVEALEDEVACGSGTTLLTIAEELKWLHDHMDASTRCSCGSQGDVGGGSDV